MIRRRIMFGIEDGGGNDANCILLLHLDNNRTNASSSGITVSQYNSIPFTTTYKKFGTHALNCTSAYYYVPDGTFNSLLLGDFTVDFWVKVSNTDSGIADFSFGTYTALDRTISCTCFTGGVRIIGKGLNANNEDVLIDTIVPYTFSSNFTHIAVVRKNDELKLFINGVLLYTFAYAVKSLYSSSYDDNLIAGGISEYGSGGGNRTYNVLDEFRVSNMARWTKNFTPPTAAYGEIDEGDVGGNDTNCITLLHFDNNATNSSSISQTWTKNQYVLYSSSVKKFGTYSMYDQYGVSEADPNPNGDFVNNTGIFYNYLTGDWTAECWFTTPAGNASYSSVLFSLQGYKTGFGYYPYFDIAVTSTGFYLRHATVNTAFDYNQFFTATIASNVWHHCAVVKKDGAISVYIDGVVKASGIAWTYTPNSAWNYSVVGTYNYGYIDEFRFSNIARWTTNFTPPTIPYV